MLRENGCCGGWHDALRWVTSCCSLSMMIFHHRRSSSNQHTKPSPPRRVIISVSRKHFFKIFATLQHCIAFLWPNNHWSISSYQFNKKENMLIFASLFQYWELLIQTRRLDKPVKGSVRDNNCSLSFASFNSSVFLLLHFALFTSVMLLKSKPTWRFPDLQNGSVNIKPRV